MNQITIITGAQGTGKTTKALELAEGKMVYFTRYTTLYEALKYMPINTDVLIFDDFDHLTEFKIIVTCQSMPVRRPYQKFEQEIKVPDLIITTSKFSPSDFRPRPNITFIHLTEQLS